MIFLKLVAVVAPLAFLFLSPRLAILAPGLGAAAGLVLWLLDSEEPPRLTAWAATLCGILVAMAKGAEGLALAVGVPIAAFVALELIEKRRGEGKLDGTPPLGALVAIGGLMFMLHQGTSPGGAMFDSPPKRVLVIGDSLTSGVPGDGVQEGWAARFAGMLGQGTELVNFSYPGDSTSESWERWGRRLESRDFGRSAGWSPELVVVVLGGNDIRARSGPDRLKVELERWAVALSRTEAKVLFVAVPGGLIGDAYSGAWREVAERNNHFWMPEDTLRKIFTTPAMTLDGIHFNERGAEFFAGEVSGRVMGE